MPTAAPFAALAGPKVYWHQVAAGMQGEMSQELGSGCRVVEWPPVMGALLTYEDRPACLRAQFHRPGALGTGTCDAEPHGARVPPVVYRAGPSRAGVGRSR